jgi:hypothetical protein
MRVRGLSTAGLVALGLLTAGLQAPGAALAAAPEAPVTEAAKAITATSATLYGELNPHSEATTGYEFMYSPYGFCEVFVTEPGAAEKGEALKVSTEVTGLEPNKTYTFCVVATQTEEEVTEQTIGQPLAFKTPTAAPAVEGESVPATTPFEATLEAQVNPNNQNTVYAFQYSTTKPAGEKLEGAITTIEGSGQLSGFGNQPASVSTGAALAPATAYYYRVLATNATGTTEGKVEEFTTPTLPAPLIEGESVLSVTQTDAQIQAFINANYQTTTFHFALGTDTSYSLVSVFAPGELGAGFSANEINVDLHAEGIELQPNTEYHYQAVATNETGTVEGLNAIGDATFLTLPNPPTASTGGATSITPNSAEISGTVNPGSSGHSAQDDTTYYFQYGSDTTYGTQIPLTPGDAGEGESPVPETAILTGLKHGATYHYRIVATNDNSGTPQTIYGEDETFTTTPTPPTLSGLTVSNLTQGGASIAAELDPHELNTRYELQVGTTPGMLQSATMGDVLEPTPLALEVVSLSPGTLYHYVLVASNSNGTTQSEGTFTTAAASVATNPLAQPTAPQLLATPAISFPHEGGHSHPPTNAAKLAAALRACKKKPRGKRAACERQAHRRYGKGRPKAAKRK